MCVHAYLDSDGPLAIAHRGGAREATENSREAFEYATLLGYRYLETDAQLTSDGVVVAFHDPDLDRVSDETGPISERTWEGLQDVRLTNGGSFVTIEDLLTDFPDVKFNIDAKSDVVTNPLLDVIERQDAFDRVCFGSFSEERLRKIRARGGERVCTSVGMRGVARFVIASCGIPIEPPQANALQLPPTFRGVPLITARLIDYAHSRGVQVHAWTIDEEVEMNRLLDLGVDGIMTDRPTLLKQVFEARGVAL